MSEQIVAQNANGIKKESRCISELKRGKLEHRVAVEILLDSNELATDILAIHGFTAYDKDGFARYDDVWKFYGVSERYFAGVLQRHWISAKSTPEDIRRDRNGIVTISPRMALALCAIMYAGRHIPDESSVMRVYKTLKGTRYYTRAKKSLDTDREAGLKHFQKHTAAVRIVESALSDEPEFIEVRDGKVLISVSGLARLVSLVGTPQNCQPVSASAPATVPAPAPRPVADRGRRSHNRKPKPVMLVSEDGTKRVFESQNQCAKFLGVKSSSVNMAFWNPGRTLRGYSVVPC